ncbi:MAG: YgiQ family radical SAM protein [Ruminococcaceae bacterium]|nr:YgiQ family radical SAM protein [Oscillospiraceae bacterium]
MAFLPVTKEELAARGTPQPDFICITGDAYVDHPSFGIAIISRIIEAEGFSVGIIAQPDWKNPAAFQALGTPKYGFFITSGNIDSMVAHYTAAKKRRNDDWYSPGRKAGLRPDRAVIVYSRMVRQIFGEIPIIIGGLEASLRRFAHYDYWDDAVRPSVLVDAEADLLTYGMGERQTREICRRLAAGEPVSSLTDIRGTCWLGDYSQLEDIVKCPPFEETANNKKSYAKAVRIQMDHQDAITGKTVVQRHKMTALIQNPPQPPLSTPELDEVFALPFERYYHPMYEPMGGVPAIEEVEFSIMHNRGCFGACAFCSIAFHQGRTVTCRSEESVLAEAKALTKNPRFKGYIHDVGGPTANFRHPSCQKQLKSGVCGGGRRCLAPKPCPNLFVSHKEYLELLRKLRKLPGIKQVFVRSGIRFDYILQDPDDSFLLELVRYHTSGQLKVAPEHCSAAVLDKMGKPHIEAYMEFARRFYDKTKGMGKEQYLVPYLMSSHPGCGLKEAIELALWMKSQGIRPRQVQDFYPTPGTVSTCMFYTGLDPYSMEPVFVPKTAEEKGLQRALLQYFLPENAPAIRKALILAGRRDLIGYGEKCLVPPEGGRKGQPPRREEHPAGRKAARKPAPTQKKHPRKGAH